jgi:hypothetical protein
MEEERHCSHGAIRDVPRQPTPSLLMHPPADVCRVQSRRLTDEWHQRYDAVIASPLWYASLMPFGIKQTNAQPRLIRERYEKPALQTPRTRYSKPGGVTTAGYALRDAVSNAAPLPHVDTVDPMPPRLPFFALMPRPFSDRPPIDYAVRSSRPDAMPPYAATRRFDTTRYALRRQPPPLATRHTPLRRLRVHADCRDSYAAAAFRLIDAVPVCRRRWLAAPCRQRHDAMTYRCHQLSPLPADANSKRYRKANVQERPNGTNAGCDRRHVTRRNAEGKQRASARRKRLPALAVRASQWTAEG